MIRFFRSCLIILCFILFGIGAAIISFVIFSCIALTRPEEKRKYLYAEVIHKAWNWFIRDLQRIGIIKINVSDMERLKNLSGKVIVASHPTFIDVVILIGLIPKSTCLAKKETLKNPLFRNIVKSIYIINDIDFEKLKADTDRFLKEGFNIIIFPSGTRTKPGEDFKIHKGSAAIALNSNSGIIPVKITTDYPFLQKGRPVYDIGEKYVSYYLEIKPQIDVNKYSDMPRIKARNFICAQIKADII